MIHTNYGYAINLEKNDRIQLENLLHFSEKNFIDFYFNKKNYDYIKKQLKENNYKKIFDKQYDTEREIIYTKDNKTLYLYL